MHGPYHHWKRNVQHNRIPIASSRHCSFRAMLAFTNGAILTTSRPLVSGISDHCRARSPYSAPKLRYRGSFLNGDTVHCAPSVKRARPVRDAPRHALLCLRAKNGHAVVPWPSTSKEIRGLTVGRRDLQQGGKRGRPVRLTRRCTLQELDLELEAPVSGSEPVDVEIISQSVNSDFRVLGAVSTTMPRACDRCLNTFDFHAKGKFEVWLSSTGIENVKGLTKEEIDNLEAIEDFSGAEATVDLIPHVRDSVILSLPSKSLCDRNCEGISPRDSSTVSVTYGELADSAAVSMSTKNLDSQLPEVTSERLLGLKRELEK